MVDKDDWSPFDEVQSAVQIEAVLALLAERGITRVLDLGCGNGRVAVPLAQEGVRVLAMDSDQDAVDATRTAAGSEGVGERVECRRADMFVDAGPWRFADGAPPQAALLLGNTLMEFTDVARVAALFASLRAALGEGGVVVIENFVRDTWADVADGAWQEGVSDDGQWQMIWTDGDDVVALRRGETVDPEDWEVRESDRLLRLWSLGSLRLLGLSSGWRGPEEDGSGALLVFGTT